MDAERILAGGKKHFLLIPAVLNGYYVAAGRLIVFGLRGEILFFVDGEL